MGYLISALVSGIVRRPINDNLISIATPIRWFPKLGLESYLFRANWIRPKKKTGMSFDVPDILGSCGANLCRA